MTFEERGVNELNGVSGTWNVHSLHEVDGEPIPEPLSPAEALVRLVAVQSDAGPPPRAPHHRRSRRGGARRCRDHSALACVRRRHPRGVGRRPRERPSPRPGAEPGVNGTLWQQIRPKGVELVRRDVHTGRIEQTISLPSDAVEFAVGFGSIWVLSSVGPDAQNPGAFVIRVDQLSACGPRRRGQEAH